MELDCCNPYDLAGQGCIAESSAGLADIHFLNFKDLRNHIKNDCLEVTNLTLCDYLTCIRTVKFNIETAGFGGVTPYADGIYKTAPFLEFNLVENACEVSRWIRASMGARFIFIVRDTAGLYWIGGLISGLFLKNVDRNSGKTFDDTSQTVVRFEGREPGVRGGWFPLLVGVKGQDPEELRLSQTRDYINGLLCISQGDDCGCNSGE